jgi:hypothetical protein
MLESILVTALYAIKEVIQNFGPVINSTLSSEGLASPGVDIIREERLGD